MNCNLHKHCHQMIVSKQYNIPLLLSKFHLFWNSGTLNRISVQSTQKLIILNQIPFAQRNTFFHFQDITIHKHELKTRKSDYFKHYFKTTCKFESRKYIIVILSVHTILKQNCMEPNITQSNILKILIMASWYV